MNNEQFVELISKVAKKIHVIELYIHIGLYRPLFKRFNGEFKYMGTPEWKGKDIRSDRFQTGPDSSINILEIRELKEPDYPSPAYYVVLKNPQFDFQKKLLKIISNEIKNSTNLKNLDPNNVCCVHYVESAIDFHPYDVKDLDKIFYYLVSGLFFKYGRKGEHTVIENRSGSKRKTHLCPTLYIGKRKIDPTDPGSVDWDINVRNKLHGLRVYYRPIDKSPEYIRFEYVANKQRLITLGLRSLKSFPLIQADKLMPFDYVVYRKRSQYKLDDAIMRKQKSRNKKYSPLSVSIIIEAHKSLIWHGLYSVDRNPDESKKERREKLNKRKGREPHSFLEIVAEVDAFKEIKKKFKITYDLNRFYPIDKNKLQDIKLLVSNLSAML